MKKEKIPRFRGNREILKKLKRLEEHGNQWETFARETYESFIRNLNIGLFQAEHSDLHQVMNQLVLASKDGMALLAGDSQEECLGGAIVNDLDGDIDEKLTRYIARTVDRFLE